METTLSHERGDLGRLLSLLARRSPVIVLAVVVAAGAAFLLSKSQDVQYDATATLLFRPLQLDAQLSGQSLLPAGDPARDAATAIGLVSLDVVRERAARALGNYTAADLEKKVNIAEQGQSNLVKITATEPSAREAARVANMVATSYLAFRRAALTGQIQDAIDRIRAAARQLPASQRRQVTSGPLQATLARLALLRSVTTGEAQLVQRAEPPSKPSSPRPLRSSLIGGFLGLIIGLALALVLEQLDRRVRRPEQLEETLGLPLLARVPRRRALRRRSMRRHGAWLAGAGPHESEPFRRLRTSLRYLDGGKRDLRSVLLTSGDVASGKTTVALELAAAAAASGSRVLLLEADLRRPQLADLLDATDRRGLGALLHGDEPVREDDLVRVVRPAGSAFGNGGGHVAFDVLVAGAPTADAAELLDSKAMRRLLHWGRGTYDLVVVDAPPPGLVSDPIPLMRQVDGVVVVGRVGRDSRVDLNHLRLDLERLQVDPVGVVANFSRDHPRANYYAKPG